MDDAQRLHVFTQVKNAYLANIGFIHESGHPEPWIIAMKCKPDCYKTMDYGLRWEIEAMFSDFKSRGFGLEETHNAVC